MATFNFENAQVGYHKMELQAVINHLRTDVIGAASDTIQKSVPVCQAAVDSFWAGQSANAFKEKLARDAQTMADTLKQLEETIDTQMWQMAKNVDAYDAEIAESINNMKD